MKGIMDYYDKTAADWAQKWYGNEEMLPSLRLFMSKLPPSPRVLDLCCGAGYESMRLDRLGARVVGLDFSAGSVSIARHRNPGLTFFIDDMLGNYSYIGEMDGIICIAGLVHLPVEKLNQAFARMREVITTGGYALIVVLNGEGKRDGSVITVDGEQYARDFYMHSLSELRKSAADNFSFVEEIYPDEGDSWKKYLFRAI